MVRVIDCSVAIKWFIPEKGRERALAVLRELLDAPEDFAVPELFYFELVHVLSNTLREVHSEHHQLFDQLLLLGVPRFSMTPDLLSETLVFRKLGLSGYDSAYVALAKLTKGKWVTFDRKAHQRIQNLHLSELLHES